MIFKAKDYIAIGCLAGCFILVWYGKDHVVPVTNAAILSYYFGRRLDEEKRNGSNKN